MDKFVMTSFALEEPSMRDSNAAPSVAISSSTGINVRWRPVRAMN